jgi:transposase
VTKRPRRRFSKEFKREAVRLVRDSGKSLSQIARELGIRNGLLSYWRDQVEAEKKTGLTPDELAELKQLRKDKARLEMEVRILGEATAFFANRNR